MTRITYEQWEERGTALFGEDLKNWLFVCPHCGSEMSAARVRAEFSDHLPRLRERDYRVESECIGRHLPGIGCDWAAYGLLSGPVFVDGTPAFDFAGKPFTGGAGQAEEK